MLLWVGVISEFWFFVFCVVFVNRFSMLACCFILWVPLVIGRGIFGEGQI
jgi:hypothetical protein